MYSYIVGFFRSIFGHGFWAWIQVGLSAYLGFGAFAQYANVRDRINQFTAVPIMPDAINWTWIPLLFLGWIIVRLAHNEAMRYSRAGRVTFGLPKVEGPWRLNAVQLPHVYEMYSATVTVRNESYRLDTGHDIERAWASIELFDLHSKLLQQWDFARWEENEKPFFQGSPTDHLPDEQNYRILSANRSPSTITVVTKPFSDDYCYRLRGIDQITGWINPENRIPPGEYLLRLTVHGKGMQESAQQIYRLNNPGKNGGFEFKETDQKIERHWP